MGTLESSVGTRVDNQINQVMERWCEENKEQSTLLREQVMEQMHQFMRMFASQQLVRLLAKFPPR